MAFDDLYCALFAHVTAIRDVCGAVAEALGAAEPAISTPWRAWLQSGDGFAVTQVVNLDPYLRDSSSHSVEAVLPQMSSEASDDDLDEMIRDWLTVFMLDLGVRDFEDDLAGFTRPEELLRR
ncbi:hypothetical protein [Nocardioides conyzicola]|uniref:hypothetical protein n=1 Tax=Nocardioides conyzicola TaxID=1651781 RepID=UPI0031E867C6